MIDFEGWIGSVFFAEARSTDWGRLRENRGTFEFSYNQTEWSISSSGWQRQVFALFDYFVFRDDSKFVYTLSGRESKELREISDDERIGILRNQLQEAQIIAEDADQRYDEV